MHEQIAMIAGKNGFIIDMDGVLYHGDRLLPGAVDFVSWLSSSGKKFVFLTNSSERTPVELKEKLDRMDTDIIAGIGSEIDTCLVLSGITSLEEVSLYPCRPKYILSSVADLINAR